MKLKVFLATLVAQATCQIVYNLNAVPLHKDQMNFLSYTARYAKSYTNTAEFSVRMQYWMSVDTFINTYEEMGMELGHNEFSDWTPEEKQKLLGARIPETPAQQSRLLADLNEQDILSDSDPESFEQTSQIKAGAKGKSNCGYGCKVCVSSTSCTLCQSANFTLSKGVCSCKTKQVNANVTECYTCQNGTYWNQTTLSCEKCSSSCATCTNSTSCTTCKPNYVKNQKNACNCPNNNLNSNGDCLVCASNQFYNGTDCQNCSTGCTSCARLSGNCTACVAPLSVQISGLCGCKSGYFYNSQKNTCTAENVCPAGKYLNSTINTCLSCGVNCANCTKYTGVCSSCIANKILVSSDPYNCVDCKTNFVSNNSNNCTCPNDNLNQKGECLVCASAQFFDGTDCQNCQINCSKCSRLTGNCTQCFAPFSIQSSGLCACKNGFFYNTTSKKCQAEAVCSAGTYLNSTDNTCLSCGDNCANCTKYSGDCTSCKINNTLSNALSCVPCKKNFVSNNSNTCTCPDDNLNEKGECFACAINQFFNGTDCQNCSTNCTSCTRLTGQCTACIKPFSVQKSGLCGCNPQYNYISSNNTCVYESACDPKFYQTGVEDNCRPCGINCATCAKYTGVCTSCLDNNTLSATNALNCVTCKPNYVSNNSDTCICPNDNFNSNGDCFSCLSNQFFNGTGCQICPANCTSCNRLTGECSTCVQSFSLQSSGSCSCQSGQFFDKSKQSCVQETNCSLGSYLNGTNNTCIKCGFKCTNCTKYTGVCTSCVDNNTLIASDTQNCSACKPNYLSNNSNVCTCPNNNTNLNGDCFACTSTQFFNGTGCQNCAANCTSCSRLTGNCTTCATPFSLQANGSCDCNVDYFYFKPNNKCYAYINCPTGQYANTTNNTCLSCGVNCANCTKYSGVCVSCKSNSIFQDAFNCVTCPPNYVSNNSNNCTCPNNNTNQNGDCFACTATQFFNGTGCQNCNTNCTTCTRLTGQCAKCIGNLVLQTDGSCGCNTGYFYNSTSKTCILEAVCSTGKYLNYTSNTCLSCGINCTSCTKVTGACTSCVLNSIFNSSDAFNCASCKPNYISNNSNTCTCPNDNMNSKGDCCASNQFFNGTGCSNCGLNCVSCTKLTGVCTSCLGNSTLNQTDRYNCYGCPFKVGPVANQTVCFQSPYSSTRIVPPFDANSTSIDWRNLTVVSPMQNQGQCGSCYSFSAIGGLESAYAIKTGRLYKLSEQHVVSCDTKQLGCNGGWQQYALKFLSINGTILSTDYPYASFNGTFTNCSTNLTAMNRAFYGPTPAYTQVVSNYTQFKTALLSQPVIISFAVGDDFNYYKSGIYTGQLCANTTNHAMQAIGLGVQNGTEYVTIKNQWGTSWGEKGYIKVALTQDTVGICQLYKYNYLALV